VRRADTPMGELPGDLEPGDIWRVMVEVLGPPPDAPTLPFALPWLLAPARADRWPGADRERVKGNLTNEVWMYVCPAPCLGLGTLVYHTVRDDDGRGCTWHGYVEHDEWRPV
jgi:hypothetical protein